MTINKAGDSPRLRKLALNKSCLLDSFQGIKVGVGESPADVIEHLEPSRPSETAAKGKKLVWSKAQGLELQLQLPKRPLSENKACGVELLNYRQDGVLSSPRFHTHLILLPRCMENPEKALTWKSPLCTSYKLNL